MNAKRVSLLVILLWIALIHSNQIAQAQSQANPSVCRQLLEYLDLNNDGTLDTIRLDCQFEQGSKDQVLVNDLEFNFTPEATWVELVDFRNEVWIFDHEADGKANLIAVFHDGAQGELIADFFDDQNGDRSVSYQVVNGQITVTENPAWTVRVVSPDGWWVRDGLDNFNLQIYIDGNVEVLFDSGYRNRLATDGERDFSVQVFDLDQDGRPDVEIRTENIPWIDRAISQGVQAIANWHDDETPLVGDLPGWPYLDISRIHGQGSRIVKDYNDPLPPIQFDPTTGRVEAVGEFVASRGGEHNCWYYSTVPWVLDEVRDADSESPFCFYDLTLDNDGIPELQVRMWRWLPNEPTFFDGAFNRPIQWISYSWDQWNEMKWTYGLGLLGMHEIDSEVTINNYQVRTVPYEEFPTWVTGHNWEAAVLVEITAAQYWTTEGIYAAEVSGVLEDEINGYLTGITNTGPSDEINPVKESRYERSLTFQQQPWLYFSPIDRQLHLLGAEEGKWNIDGTRMIEYRNLDGDAYLDEWKYFEDGELLYRLQWENDFLIYSEPASGTVRLKQVQIDPSLFETLPPTDHAEWLELGRKLDFHQREFLPGDFRTFLEQVDGPEMELVSAQIRDFRPAHSGFRFTLELNPGFRYVGEDWLDLTGRDPGTYVVRYNGDFSTQIFKPISLHLSPSSNLFTLDQPREHVQSSSAFTLQNQGLVDAETIVLTATLHSPSGEVVITQPQTVKVPAEGTTQVYFHWTPGAPGEWKIQAHASLLNSDGEPVSLVQAEQDILVQPAQDTDLNQNLSAFGLNYSWQTLLLLASIAVTGGSAGWVLAHQLKREKNTRVSIQKATRQGDWDVPE